MSWSIATGLEGKSVVVTGAGGGIGREIAAAFAAAGARVCAADLSAESAREVAEGLDGGHHLAEQIDIRDLSGHESLLRRAHDAFGRFDVLANAAAVLIRRTDVDEVTEDDWDTQHDVNLKAAFFLNRAAGRLLREQGRGGRIINFTSQGWWSGGFGGSVAYAATKGGIVSMSRGLARTYAPDGITVNTVSPGAVDTEMFRSGLDPAQLQAQVDQIPLGYIAEPADLAGIVVFLASDHSRYITGATINVSGGWLMY
jgi:NAD(P)-dependent dehydrogenase (short-subunit alcohol dehydrogenase family)